MSSFFHSPVPSPAVTLSEMHPRPRRLIRQYHALPPLSTNLVASQDSVHYPDDADAHDDAVISGNTHALVFRGSTYTWTVPPAPTDEGRPRRRRDDGELSPLDIAMGNDDSCASLLFSDDGSNNGLVPITFQNGITPIHVLGPFNRTQDDAPTSANSTQAHRDSPVPWSPQWTTSELETEEGHHSGVSTYTGSDNSFSSSGGSSAFPEDMVVPHFPGYDHDLALPLIPLTAPRPRPIPTDAADDIASYLKELSMQEPTRSPAIARAIVSEEGFAASLLFQPGLPSPQISNETDHLSGDAVYANHQYRTGYEPSSLGLYYVDASADGLMEFPMAAVSPSTSVPFDSTGMSPHWQAYHRDHYNRYRDDIWDTGSSARSFDARVAATSALMSSRAQAPASNSHHVDGYANGQELPSRDRTY